MNDALILVADFGFAKKVPEGGLTTRCGTPAFVAPEIVLGTPYTQAADMWSVGVCLFLLLGGYPPFQDKEHRGLFRKIRAADFVFHETYWEHVSVEAKQVVSSLLVVDPGHRLTAAECIQSKWLLMKDEVLSDRDLSPSLSEIKKFHGKQKLKSAMHAINWATSATFFHPETATFSQQVSVWDKALESAPADGITHREAVKVGFRDTYDLKTKIRKGSFATVWECVHKSTGELYAVKVIKREGLKPADDEAVLNEVAILQSLMCKDIVQLVDFYEEKDYFFMVMEYMQGGDVFDKIVEKNHYTEKDARDLVIVLLRAVRFMHGRGITHRDLKPQNLLLLVSFDQFDMTW
jgi:serine/threonine protein kinase